MAIYASKQDLLDRDEGFVWNTALDRSTNTLSDTAIDQCLEQADEEINSFLSRRFVLPLVTVPGLLNKLAIVITFYWLADRDNQVTELLDKRYRDALATLREIVDNKRDLGLPTLETPAEGATGKVTLVQEGERLFSRQKLSGVL
ncbi:DUF1320 domain-containing protein [Shewanella algae]|uniref:gp436 family protein n=1 Tax=Shewanella algae TaxID=38313 RepID=UPI0031F532CC